MTDQNSGDGLQGLRVLVVEDETLVAMLLEDMLADHGCVVAAVAARVPQALELIADDSLVIQAAILDVNLAGQPSFPLAEALAAKGVPFVFATGYGAGGLPEAWRDRPTLQKPFSHDDVGRMLLAAIGG
jgi:CheY-like chemotaxis protein